MCPRTVLKLAKRGESVEKSSLGKGGRGKENQNSFQKQMFAYTS